MTQSFSPSTWVKVTLTSLLFPIFTFALSFILLFALPFSVLFSSPLFLYRYFLHKISPFIRPNLGKMVTSRGAVFAIDDLHTRPKSTVVAKTVVKGVISLESFRTHVTNRLINYKIPETEDLKYPELQQYLTSWAGFLFWKNDPDFQVENHVNCYKPPKEEQGLRYLDAQIQEIWSELAYKSWARSRPLWEIILIQNYFPKVKEHFEIQVPAGVPISSDPHTVIFLRIHHSVADGYSIFSLVTEGLAETPEVKNAIPRSPRTPRSMWQTLSRTLQFPFRSSYELSQCLLRPLQPTVPLPFRVPLKMQTEGKFHVGITSHIPVHRIKQIKDHFKVSFTSVILTLLAGALRDLMIKKQLKIPERFPCLIPLPIPGHPNKLRNYLSAAIPLLPTGEADHLKRLQLCHKEYEYIKRSAFPLVATFGFMMIGSYFTWMTRILTRNYFSSSWLTSFPGGMEPYGILGHELQDVGVILGLQKGHTGIGISAVSYVNNLSISILGDSAVLTSEDITQFISFVEKHVDNLFQQIAV